MAGLRGRAGGGLGGGPVRRLPPHRHGRGLRERGRDRQPHQGALARHGQHDARRAVHGDQAAAHRPRGRRPREVPQALAGGAAARLRGRLPGAHALRLPPRRGRRRAAPHRARRQDRRQRRPGHPHRLEGDGGPGGRRPDQGHRPVQLQPAPDPAHPGQLPHPARQPAGGAARQHAAEAAGRVLQEEQHRGDGVLAARQPRLAHLPLQIRRADRDPGPVQPPRDRGGGRQVQQEARPGAAEARGAARHRRHPQEHEPGAHHPEHPAVRLHAQPGGHGQGGRPGPRPGRPHLRLHVHRGQERAPRVPLQRVPLSAAPGLLTTLTVPSLLHRQYYSYCLSFFNCFICTSDFLLTIFTNTAILGSKYG